MDKIQINKSRMFDAVELVFDNHSDLIIRFPELLAALEKFKNGKILIDQNRQVQEVNAAGLTINKVKLREELIHEVLHISAALRAYATSAVDLKLKTLADYSETDLKRKSDKILCDIGDLLMNQALPIKTELEKYAVDDDKLDKIKSLLVQFKAAMPQKRGADNISKVSTGNIADVFKSQIKLLKEEIDVHMRPFEFTHPDFFNTYKNSRNIVNYKGGGKSAPKEPPATK